MDPEDRDLLERTFKLARDNNRLLQSMSRASLFNALFRILAWGIVVIGALWIYLHYVGPTISNTTHTINQVQGASDAANSQLQGFRGLLNKLQETLPNVASSTKSQ